MDSALRPRDIQARIRAGESPEDVAAAAGVPVERIDAFAAPVMAERDHVAGLARANPVRRQGETTSHRNLRNAVVDALVPHGVDDDAIDWDSWKLADRRWQVRVSWQLAGAEHTALFAYDQAGRFTVADNDEARRLIGDLGSDDLAWVRATQDAAVDAREAAAPSSPSSPSSGSTPVDSEQAKGADAVEAEHEADDFEDAFHEADLQEVDGVYDIVPPSRKDLDALYDMLSSFDEDSVKIYAGLVHPKEASPAPRSAPPAVEDAPAPEPARLASEPDEEPEPVADDELTGDAPALEARPEMAQDANEVPENDAEREAPSDEPEQLSLIDDVEDPPRSAQPRRPRRKRASVPSWDEIMFGSPAPRVED
ncbi:MAG: septation protein SepH [Actinomycetes bacterium]